MRGIFSSMLQPVLADAVTLDTGVVGAVIAVITVVLSVGGSFLAFWKSATTVENRVNTQGQDIEALSGELAAVKKEFSEYKEAAQKRHDDLVHRLAQMETREGRADERMQAMQQGMHKLEKGQDRIESKLDDLLSMERAHAKRRRTDTDEAA